MAKPILSFSFIDLAAVAVGVLVVAIGLVLRDAHGLRLWDGDQ